MNNHNRPFINYEEIEPPQEQKEKVESQNTSIPFINIDELRPQEKKEKVKPQSIFLNIDDIRPRTAQSEPVKHNLDPKKVLETEDYGDGGLDIMTFGAAKKEKKPTPQEEWKIPDFFSNNGSSEKNSRESSFAGEHNKEEKDTVQTVPPTEQVPQQTETITQSEGAYSGAEAESPSNIFGQEGVEYASQGEGTPEERPSDNTNSAPIEISPDQILNVKEDGTENTFEEPSQEDASQQSEADRDSIDFEKKSFFRKFFWMSRTANKIKAEVEKREEKEEKRNKRIGFVAKLFGLDNLKRQKDIREELASRLQNEDDEKLAEFISKDDVLEDIQETVKESNDNNQPEENPTPQIQEEQVNLAGSNMPESDNGPGEKVNKIVDTVLPFFDGLTREEIESALSLINKALSESEASN